MVVFITIIAGGLLALMIYLNGSLASYTDSIWASFITHLVGTFGALVVVSLLWKPSPPSQSKAPSWAYAGGVLGGMTVVLANITFNSKLGISGSIVLMLLGQTVFSVLIDRLGWFGSAKRRIGGIEYLQIAMICVGSWILVFYAK